jgi:hypothetical protein
MKTKVKLGTAILALTAALALAETGVAAQKTSMSGMHRNGKDVYVCSCMQTKSCPCMTEANMKGKCACGSKAPEMKAVPRDGAWARTNRRALAH